MVIEAQKICMGCPVRRECDEYRQATDTGHGVWAAKHIKRGE